MNTTDLNISIRLFNTMEEFQQYLLMIGISRNELEQIISHRRGTVWQLTRQNNVVFFPEVLKMIINMIQHYSQF